MHLEREFALGAALHGSGRSNEGCGWLRFCYEEAMSSESKTVRIIVFSLILLAAFTFVLAATTYAGRRGTSEVAYMTYTSYGWPNYWLSINIEDTGLREFYEDTRPHEVGRSIPKGMHITHLHIVDGRAFVAAVTTSAGIVCLLWLPFVHWWRKQTAGKSKTQITEQPVQKVASGVSRI